MKTKLRLLFIGAALFVIYVSYKILEPEFSRMKERSENSLRSRASDENYDTENHHRGKFDIDNGAQTHEATVKEGNVTINQVIDSMIERYSPYYGYKLNNTPWNIAAQWVEPRQIHPENAKELGAVLNAMAKGTITSADFGQKGTQLKLTLMIDDVQKVIFKPAWYPRDYIVTGTPYAGRDRHNAEIAAFHLGRILELRRTPLAIGRRLSIEKEILPAATARLKTTFFEKDGESCFYGRCLYCKGPDDGVCASHGIIEGTLVLWLPTDFKMTIHKHPWSRTYRDGVQAKWETDDAYCAKVKKVPKFNSGHQLLDIIDTSIFDYLIGNADRHHYETFENKEDSMLIILDNGKSFGNPGVDELTILAPLYQCCQIRASLWQKLLTLQDGILSKVLSGILANDPIAPVLTQPHLDALDRRLKTILDQIQACIAEVGTQAIVFESSIKGR
ncbi:unnamed protein product [Lymnaea stagnalis]|uniref:FAM20 C-terminal domain-containing protein n=1 Tax=Lymnaea stagnalis TaxID=6523 RepID=A0AAV2HKL5_LYMST